MKSSRKEVLTAVLLILLTLLIGLGAQQLLYVRNLRRAEREAEAITGRMLSEIHRQAEAETNYRNQAAERMKMLPAEKRQRLDALQLDLLTVVSAASPMREGYVPELETVIGEYQMDARCARIVMQMIEDCQEAGGQTMICSAYRTQEYQQELFEKKVERILENSEVSWEWAEVMASEEVARPGTSEHQLGLAADLIDESYPYLNELQENTFTQIWLKEHAQEYGFILRYPNGTSDITGIIYEPWHYRYVGEKFAREITKRGLTLEEYVIWRRGR